MPNKSKKSVVELDSEKLNEILDAPDRNVVFKLTIDLDEEKVKIITIPINVIKDKLRDSNG